MADKPKYSLLEIERRARAFEPPPFATREITNDPAFSGAARAMPGKLHDSGPEPSA